MSRNCTARHAIPGISRASPAARAAGLPRPSARACCPMAHATDGFGSIRAPAACCGLVGLKPTRGRNTMAPYSGEGLAGCSAEHAVTLSVRDSAALLDATAGAGPGDPYGVAPPARPFLQEAGAAPGRLRIAWTAVTPNGARVDPEPLRVLGETVRLCAELGHHVEEAESGRRRRRDRPDVHHAGRRQHRREPGQPSDRWTHGARRTRSRRSRSPPVRRVSASPRRTTCAPRQTAHRLGRQMAAFHAQLGRPAHARTGHGAGEARLDRHDARRRRRVLAARYLTSRRSPSGSTSPGQPATMLPLGSARKDCLSPCSAWHASATKRRSSGWPLSSRARGPGSGAGRRSRRSPRSGSGRRAEAEAAVAAHDVAGAWEVRRQEQDAAVGVLLHEGFTGLSCSRAVVAELAVPLQARPPVPCRCIRSPEKTAWPGRRREPHRHVTGRVARRRLEPEPGRDLVLVINRARRNPPPRLASRCRRCTRTARALARPPTSRTATLAGDHVARPGRSAPSGRPRAACSSPRDRRAGACTRPCRPAPGVTPAAARSSSHDALTLIPQRGLVAGLAVADARVDPGSCVPASGQPRSGCGSPGRRSTRRRSRA